MGSQASLWPGAAAWITYTNMAFGGIAGHGGSLRPSPEKNPSSSLASFVTQSQGSPKTSSQVRGLNPYLLKLQAVVHYSAIPTGLTMTACRPQSTLLPVTFLTSSVLFLSLAHTLLPSSIFPTSPSHICSFSVSGWPGLPCFILLMWPNV